MILIYSPANTPRLKYILDLFVTDLMGFEFRLTQNAEEFKQFSGAKINYGDSAFADELFIYADNLLFEKGLKDQSISFIEWEGEKAFFATHPKYAVPFDPFAASFYLVSRYEEYLPHLRDAHDRYNASESLAYQKGFLQKPLVNIWAKKMKELILKRFPGTPFVSTRYHYISTIDIDNAYAYLEKGFMRTAGAFVRSFAQFNFSELLDRTKVLTGFMKDPYDTFELQLALQNKHRLKVIYFILLSEYGTNDKNVPPDSKKFQSLIKSLADYAEVGIHPSYGSNKEPKRLRKEIGLLNKILKREVTKSRQHFLKIRLPNTYRQLMEYDITDDYSLGYATDVGFRASICSTFLFYDLDLEQTTNLRIHPFAAMDATLKYYMKVPPSEALNHIRPLIEEVRAVDGTFISLWHNESLSENFLWAGWKDVYHKMVELAAE